MNIGWEAAWASDVGRARAGNEDSCFVDVGRGVFLVADGMGGHAAGEIASALAARTAGETLVQAVAAGRTREELRGSIREAFRTAQRELIRTEIEDPRTRGMGTTLTLCVILPDHSFLLGHVGDSRAYRLRDGEFEQLTSDHTWIQRQVETGQLTAAAARAHPYSHILTRVLIGDIAEEPDLLSGTLEPGDLLLLATDGLTGMLDDPEIRRILSQELALPRLTEELINAANARGGIDNITAVLVRALPRE